MQKHRVFFYGVNPDDVAVIFLIHNSKNRVAVGIFAVFLSDENFYSTKTPNIHPKVPPGSSDASVFSYDYSYMLWWFRRVKDVDAHERGYI